MFSQAKRVKMEMPDADDGANGGAGQRELQEKAYFSNKTVNNEKWHGV